MLLTTKNRFNMVKSSNGGDAMKTMHMDISSGRMSANDFEFVGIISRSEISLSRIKKGIEDLGFSNVAASEILKKGLFILNNNMTLHEETDLWVFLGILQNIWAPQENINDALNRIELQFFAVIRFFIENPDYEITN